MKIELIKLREKMEEHHLDAYLIPTTDYHGSEYVNDYFKCREFISGFTGSAGTLLVMKDSAKLWTDGRYFIQCASQLEGSGIDMMKMNDKSVPSIPDYLALHMPESGKLGFDGRVVSSHEGKEYEKALANKHVEIIALLDLVDEIWPNRPSVKPSQIYSLPISVTGQASESKLANVRLKMKEANADYHLITNLEEIAWLLNLRGSDIANTPVFFAFALISQEQANIYLYKEAVKSNLIAPEFTLKNYLDIQNDLSKLPSNSVLWAYEVLANYSFINTVPKDVKIIDKPGPIELMKSIKNQIEISSTKNAHIKDGVAMVNFLYWLKSGMAAGMNTSEIGAADYLEKCRRDQEGCFDLSFPTIAGYGEHGAIIHYGPTPETDKPLQPEGFLLVDSGGQYKDGTTDITRTIALGTITDKMKKYYTYVLACHIELSTIEFKAGTTGSEIDEIVRKPLHAHGLDFNHGTGHGVGHILSVHEGPNSISPRSNSQPILPGMITSNEPGVYIENEFGIRIENEILCKKIDDETYGFDTITLCPYDRTAIDTNELNQAQIDWINQYHKHLYNTLSPYLNSEVKAWLRKETEQITK